jgi:diguanylate cyclase (GGDEF)-like protein
MAHRPLAGPSTERRAAVVGRWRATSWLQRALVGYYGLYVLWYLASGTTGRLRTAVSDGAYLPLDAAGIAVSLLAASRASRRRDRSVWLLIALALTLRLWGDAAWFWLEAVRQSDPFPSVADIGFFGFYPLLTLALALVPVRAQSRRASVGNLLDVLAVVGGAFMVIWYLVLGAALEDGVSSLGQLLDVAYPLWDLVLVLAGGRVLLRGTDPRWTVRARWLIAGALLFVLGDTGFGYLAGLDGFTGGGWLDLPWIGALLCFALAAGTRPRTTATRDGALAGHAHLLPVLAVAGSYAVVARVALHLPLFPVGGVLLSDLAITIVVVGRQLVAVAEHRDLAATYHRAAVTDSLTGVASRSHFLEQAASVLAAHPAGRCAVVMVDLDHFKSVNDVHGHLAGDAALRTVAAHLRASVREADLLGRFGGDEFVALLVDLTQEQAAGVVDRMTEVSGLPPGGRPLSLSVGWACHGTTLDELLGRADTALYAAKAAGRGRAVALHDLVEPLRTDARDGADCTPAA